MQKIQFKFGTFMLMNQRSQKLSIVNFAILKSVTVNCTLRKPENSMNQTINLTRISFIIY